MSFNKQCDVWKYFDTTEEGDFATCKTCKSKLKTNRISNLKAHIVKVHHLKITPPSELSELLNEYLTKDIEVKASCTTDVHAKIENLQLSFVRSDADILQFWKEKQLTDPVLYALRKVCFAIPPTQVCTCLTILLFKVYFLIVIYYS